MVYKLDGKDIKTEYGVTVSGSRGVLDLPKLKERIKFSWPDRHGLEVDTTTGFFEAREIILDCFLSAEDADDFIDKSTALNEALSGLCQLMITVDGYTTPLLFMVYCEDGIQYTKRWRSGEMVATFQLKLIEPEPVKIYGTVTITAPIMGVMLNFNGQDSELINIYWGDGVSEVKLIDDGDNTQLEHTYTSEGTYYVMIYGNVSGVTVTNEDDSPFQLYP